MASSCPSSAAYGFGQRSSSKDGDLGLEDLFREQLELVEEDAEDENMVHFLFGEKEPSWVAEKAEMRKREADEKKQEEEEKKRRAEERKRKEKELKWRREKHDAVIKSIRKFDPKSKCLVWTRFPFEEFSSFDLDEESNYPPMRNTHRKYQIECEMFCSANILTVKIISSDVGFPLNVYGTVIARDSLDNKCVYLFRCHRRDSQLIKNEDDPLILIGPARGLLLIDFIFLEVDLYIRDDRGQDKKLGNGLLQIDGRQITQLEENEVMSATCASWLSTVEVKYTTVRKAVEATVEICVRQGYFCGKISAHTSSIPDEIVLYKGEEGGVMTSDGTTNIQLWRRVVAVCLMDKLIVTISARGATEMSIKFSPALSGSTSTVYESPLGEYLVNVTWSVIDE
ncbi:unnamed protein product [Urochloa humidicola]